MKNNKGFTLLELLVVIIIVGVLASVALPSLFSNIHRSYATEATTALGLIKRGLQACSLNYGGNPVPCAPNTPAAFDSIAMTDPSFSAGKADSQFNYAIFCGGISASSFNCSIVATDKDDNGNTLTISYTSGGSTKSATSVFSGVW